mmetsp:Transcript_71266/g.199865  ORF Transcript_71266/g.199865 Transcript_71266/m.199865 type:complete len:212 (+) Transcript_71266:173-808(+)
MRRITARTSFSTLTTACLLFWYCATALSWAFSLAWRRASSVASSVASSWNWVWTPSGFAALMRSNFSFAASRSCFAFFCSAATALDWPGSSFNNFSKIAVFSATRFLHSATAFSSSSTLALHFAMASSKLFLFFSAASCLARAASASLRAFSAAAAAAAAASLSDAMSFPLPSSVLCAWSTSRLTVSAAVLRRSNLDCAAHSPPSPFSSLT